MQAEWGVNRQLPGNPTRFNDLEIKGSWRGPEECEMKSSYDAQAIEAKWQQYWREHDTFKVDLKDDSKPKFYMLCMYPYPSGALHTGHVMEYTIGDLLARFKRMRGFNVFFPMGFDSFGLPAENVAIRENIPPAKFTYDNIDRMTEQMKRSGWSITWSATIATSHPGYYKWNQWIFLKLLEKGLAYKKLSAVNWCPQCKTVLANEQVVNGKCERHGVEVSVKQLNQWFFRITDYAERLLTELPPGWDENVTALQKQWIGKSEGARIDFTIEATGETLSVFTTRPDTIYGVTFMSLAPEHPLIERLVKGTPREAEVMAFVNRVTKTPSYERSAETAEKEGVFTGHHIINPLNGERAQLWVANYALMEYGTGAVMAVPAHDQRDFEFARKYGIPIKVVIQPKDQVLQPEAMTEAYIEDGVQVNSAQFDGLLNREAMQRITTYLAERHIGGATINYRLRDWLVSRQRYWGTPIPVIYCDKCGTVPVPEDQLPVRLPPNVDFKPTGKSPLASVPEFVNVPCPQCGKPARRETDTMDTFVDSSWYFMRYLSARDDMQPINNQLVTKWLPIDQYIGGIEHASGHLIFSRFFTKFLADIGAQPYPEYATNMFAHGMICMLAYHCPTCGWVHRSKVKDGNICATCGGPLKSELTKMSKTKLNTISPDELYAQYGADSLRLYIMFMGPPHKSTEYNDRGLVGVNRFLNRLFDLISTQADSLAGVECYSGDGSDLDKPNRELRSKLHQTIKKVTSDFESFSYNTSVAAIMELFNSARGLDKCDPRLTRQILETMVILLYPITPHISEELWGILGHEPSLQMVAWPDYDEEAARFEEIEVVFQVNGQMRGKAVVALGISDDELKEVALATESVKRHLEGKTVRKVIVIKGRLVNIVVS